MPPARPLITLLTDFGDRDYFVASMKGVILTINPAAHIVDLSHGIDPYQIQEAGYVLKSCYRNFPDGTIHVAVVDPGVGTSRRPLLISTDHCFLVGPDNGLFGDILEQESTAEVRQIEHPQYRLESIGSTFDGRDVFAPAAAWLSKAAPPASFGRLIHDPVRRATAEPRWENRRLFGQVVYVDRFGNLISNLATRHMNELRAITNRAHPLIQIGGRTISGLVGSYHEGDAQAPHALINSNGYLEIFLREGSVAEALKLRVAEPIILQ